MTTPRTMRALQQTTLDGPRGLRLVEVPVPIPGPGEILIRVAAAGVNFVDLARGRGTFGDNPRPPFIAGFEAAGETAEGKLVVGAGAGAFAEYMVLPARAAMPVPPGWTAQHAVGLAITWPTALATLRLARLAAGETVLVHAAAGATGQAVVKLAKQRGARVIATASAHKHAAVRADHVLDANTDFVPAVLELTGGRGADVVLESVGGATFAASLASTRRITGRVVVLGLAAGEASLRNWDLVYAHPVQVLGFNLGALIHRAPELFGEIMGELAGLLAAGVIAPLSPTTYPLADGARALHDLETRATIGKLALLP